MLAELQPVSDTGGWEVAYSDPSTGQRWTRTYLGSGSHGGGVRVLIRDPDPGVDELLALAENATEAAEVAAAVWLLTEKDPQGMYKETLVSLAEEIAGKGDHGRAALIVGWGDLLSEMNLRPCIGKALDEVTRDHEHFRQVAARARRLLTLSVDDPLLRDMAVFGYE